MTKEIEAVYEQGVFRPLEPLGLPEGARLRIILVSRYEESARRAADRLAEIATLPLEGATDDFSGKDHDSILYPPKVPHDLR
ncbi:MAG: antitoxin family protein [Acidobacteria bacterium]|nr:antitoxin family protein [Acidobacteriota bacterium]